MDRDIRSMNTIRQSLGDPIRPIPPRAMLLMFSLYFGLCFAPSSVATPRSFTAAGKASHDLTPVVQVSPREAGAGWDGTISVETPPGVGARADWLLVSLNRTCAIQWVDGKATILGGIERASSLPTTVLVQDLYRGLKHYQRSWIWLSLAPNALNSIQAFAVQKPSSSPTGTSGLLRVTLFLYHVRADRKHADLVRFEPVELRLPALLPAKRAASSSGVAGSPKHRMSGWRERVRELGEIPTPAVRWFTWLLVGVGTLCGMAALGVGAHQN